MKSEGILFSVIVPACNAEKTLPACLEALGDQSVARTDYEVIVVDDGSTDRTSETAKRSNVKYLFQPNQGPAAARNRGAAEARGHLIFFTDSDCVPDHKWLEEMARPFGDPEVAGVKGAYKTKQRELAARFAQAEFEDRYDLLRKSPAIDMVDTYSAAFGKDVFSEIGGFDRSFPVANNEDTDLSYRLVAAGRKLVFNPEAFVYHTHPDTFVKYLEIKFWRGYWRMVVYRRYPDKAVKDSYTPGVVKVQTVLMALSFLLFPVSPFVNTFLYLALLSWGVIVVSALPFSLKTLRKDKPVGLISPGIVLLRSMVFATGSLFAIARHLV
ncbi:MAG: glycosyltransferase [Syntrophales bacterium]|nr:glycosyltransferase [Syntrophales bacterium]